MLFKYDINGWESWGKVFYSIEAFSSLVFEILNREKLVTYGNLENLTPGSNAVFKIDNLVIKLYAPKEAGVDTEYDYNVELYSMEFANSQGVPVPRVIAKGKMEDKYLFRYIIMEYSTSDLRIEELLAYPLEKKFVFAQKIKKLIEKLNHPVKSVIKPINSRNREEQINRMKGLNKGLIDELMEYSTSLECQENVLVHGDITRDNILINRDLGITLIDFADCVQAPFFYEFPPIVFDLFMCDRELVSCFIEETEKDEFLELLIMGLSIHAFCGFILKDYFERNGIDFDSVKNINALRNILKVQLF